MTVPLALENGCDDEAANHLRPAKRLKTITTPRLSNGDTGEQATLVRRHPLGVRPSGNALTSNVNLKASAGSLARLPDELLMHILETLEAPDLLRLGGACRMLHAFTRNDELWRTLFVE